MFFVRIVYKASTPERLGGPCFLWHVQENRLHANGTEHVGQFDKIENTRSEQLTLRLNTQSRFEWFTAQKEDQ